MKFLKAFVAWYTPGKREALQYLAISFLPILVAGGLIMDAHIEPWALIITAVLQAVSNLSNLIHLEKGNWSEAWETVRLTIYTFSAAAAPAFMTLGFILHEQKFVTIVSFILGIIGNLVALVTIDNQYKTWDPPKGPGLSV